MGTAHLYSAHYALKVVVEMGVRENKVETYLDEQIEKHFNGITHKWVSPGHDGVPDRICFINPEWFVEVKTSDGVQFDTQKREAKRLIKHGARVAIVYGHEGVDEFIHWLKSTPSMKYIQQPVQLIFK